MHKKKIKMPHIEIHIKDQAKQDLMSIYHVVHSARDVGRVFK